MKKITKLLTMLIIASLLVACKKGALLKEAQIVGTWESSISDLLTIKEGGKFMSDLLTGGNESTYTIKGDHIILVSYPDNRNYKAEISIDDDTATSIHYKKSSDGPEYIYFRSTKQAGESSDEPVTSTSVDDDKKETSTADKSESQTSNTEKKSETPAKSESQTSNTEKKSETSTKSESQTSNTEKKSETSAKPASPASNTEKKSETSAKPASPTSNTEKKSETPAKSAPVSNMETKPVGASSTPNQGQSQTSEGAKITEEPKAKKASFFDSLKAMFKSDEEKEKEKEKSRKY